MSTSVEATMQDQLLWFSVKKLKRCDATTLFGLTPLTMFEKKIMSFWKYNYIFIK